MNELIKQGHRSTQVADVQIRLRAFGLAVDDDPGFFGTSTYDAVRTFQQQRDLLVDGIVGPQTWRELVEASWRLGDRILYLKQPPMRGDDVTTLQARLNALGFDSGKEDGIFGTRTDRALRAFQREYAVAGDGIFGPASHAALIGLRVDRPGTSAALREELQRAERTGMDHAVVLIDPGHGGDDEGELGPEGTVETQICWDIARRLADYLSGSGAHVRFTRTEAEGIDASERARRANDLKADVLVSLHLNSHEEPTAEGASTYYFRGSPAGAALAECVQEQLVRLGRRDCRSHARSYAILKETRMPAVLVEPAFISCPHEAKQLQDPVFRHSVAQAIAAGIRDYFNAS